LKSMISSCVWKSKLCSFSCLQFSLTPQARCARKASWMSPSFDLIIFGGTGDLAMRKLLPALYFRNRDGDLHPDSRIIGVARQDLSREEFVAHVKDNC